MPTASEAFAESFGRVAEQANRLRAEIGEEGLLSAPFAERADYAPEPFVRRVLGVAGAIDRATGAAEPTITILLASSFPALRTLGTATELAERGQSIRLGLGSDLLAILERSEVDPARTTLIELPPAIPFVGPGERAHCAGMVGSFGSRVTSTAGARSIMTSGHGVPSIAGAPAYDDAATLIGLVSSSDCPLGGVPGQDYADVAVVDLQPSVPDTSLPTPGGVTVGVARVWDDVTSNGPITSARSPLLTVGAPFAGPQRSDGNWGEAMLTARAISAPGDSGAPVYNAAGELIGHVVAGYPGVYTVVQDVTFQLKAVDAAIR
jgi:hypothetical protein